ncbi:SLA1 [Candida pseudojiufengensis]|uniref:SLA1 n=1 Tax=Candida pseudojiufengensis TaxID=497109 RepID=UPI00222456BC|nr:SLA1 [Candida pseudojiufengensis]KAI5963343.1 SLA1 [Candida pseudojiufengensis]
MSYIGVYKAVYDYDAQADEELTIAADDLLYLLEKSDIDEWWKVKKRVIATGNEIVDEPQGLVPSNYIEEAPILRKATALYDYDKQTEEELSFKENEIFNIYDLSDPDWILVGNLNQTEFGFIPSNYIQLDENQATSAQQPIQQSQQQAIPPKQIPMPLNNFAPPPQHPTRSSEHEIPPETPEKDYPRQLEQQSPLRREYHEEEVGGEEEEEEAPPPMPSRPSEPETNVGSSRNYEREADVQPNEDAEHSYDGEFFTWHIDEVDGRKKRPIKVSIGQGLVIIKPNTQNPKKLRLRSDSKIDNQWRIRDLVSFNNEKKHVFLEFKNPPASLELHTGTKDVAEAIMAILGDLKGAEQAKGLKEVQQASQTSTGGANKKIGRLIYDFKAQGDDELNCREGDEVYIVNESRSTDWWMVQNVDTGRQGVVPSSYIEVISTSNLDDLTDGPLRRKSTKSKGKVVNGRDKRQSRSRGRDERERVREKDRAYREKQTYDENDKSMPNYHRVRTWIDSSGTFKVEAEFLGCVEGKVHLHKTNGVKIAVAAEKLSIEDLEYVEKITGTSLENYKQLVQKQMEKRARSKSKSGATVSEPEHKKPQSATAAINNIEPSHHSKSRPTTQVSNNGAPAYDWFDFFLSCGVDVGNCQRYTLNFEREQMDENILEDISPSLLRTLGLREGDIIRVMKFLDNKYDRKKSVEPEQQQSGGLFLDTNGALKNNSATELSKVTKDALPSPIKTQQTQLNNTNTPSKIDDDAWAMKPAARSNENLLKSTPQPQTPQYTGSLSDLVNIKPMENKSEPQKSNQTPSLPPLQPTKTANSAPAPPQGAIPLPAQRTGGFVPVQRTGAGLQPVQTGGFMPSQPTGFIPITAQPTGFVPIQATGILQPQFTFGIIPLQTGQTVNQQRTGGNLPPPTTFGQSSQQQQQSQPFQPSFIPLQTGPITMPQTTFGSQNTGGLPPPTSFGQQLQPTGGFPPTSFNQPPLQPTQRTGGQITGGFVPQSNFGKQITGGFMNTNTVPFGQSQQPQNNIFPQTSFGQQQQTGGIMPQTSFGQAQQPTGLFSQPSFGQPLPQQQQPNFFNQNTGGLPPQTSFGQPNMFQQQTFNQPQQPQTNQMTNMFSNTSISSPPQFNSQMPTTSFGNNNSNFEGFNSQQLQSQPTGMGFGNSPLQTQQTGRRANLAAATPDNPFGF